jgi:hypothetical protein
MSTMTIERRGTWRSLSHQDKHARLQDLRRRQQQQVELEMLRLQHLAR